MESAAFCGRQWVVHRVRAAQPTEGSYRRRRSALRYGLSSVVGPGAALAGALRPAVVTRPSSCFTFVRDIADAARCSIELRKNDGDLAQRPTTRKVPCSIRTS
jgi:hypothetical protein